MRLFIAVNINSRSKKLVERKVKLLKSELTNNIKWVDKDKWHLTLKFIGETSDKEKGNLIKVLKNIKFNQKNEYIQFANLDAFPNYDAAKVLYLALEKGEDQLKVLHDSLEKELLKYGFERDQRDYIPHLTLGRNKNEPLNLKTKFRNNNFINIYAQIKSISLYKSILKTDGPEYIELFSIK